MSSEIYWEYNDTEINAFFDEFKQIANYPNFKFKYNWKNFPEIENYLKRLMYSSFSRSNEVRERLPELIRYVEDFFAQAIKDGFITKQNYKKILERLKDKENGFRAIKALPEKGWFGKSIDDVIEINMNMTHHRNSPRLSPNDLTRLYLYHEIGHKILHIHSNDIVIEKYLATVDGMLQDKGVDKPDTLMKETIPYGFLMIEECLTQELAERLTYEILGIERPKYKDRHEIASIQPNGEETYIASTNHDFYGLFQEPTINFGRTLRGCSHRLSTNETILSAMIHKALNTDFDEEVLREYNCGPGTLYQDLFKSLRAMGLILIQKYATFGNGTPVRGVTVANCMKEVNGLAQKNEDMRPYPVTGFPKIDYTKYLIPSSRPTFDI